MIRLFILSFILLFAFTWLFSKAVLIFIELAYAIVCFLLMSVVVIAVSGMGLRRGSYFNNSFKNIS